MNISTTYITASANGHIFLPQIAVVLLDELHRIPPFPTRGGGDGEGAGWKQNMSD
jgi:hypothetical protein